MKRFVFTFTHDTAVGQTVYTFSLTGPQHVFDDWDERYDTQHLMFVGDMEEYGVHDYATTGDEEFVGYFSYEVEPSDWQKVAEQWSSYMSENGFTVGAIEKMTLEDYEVKYR